MRFRAMSKRLKAKCLGIEVKDTGGGRFGWLTVGILGWGWANAVEVAVQCWNIEILALRLECFVGNLACVEWNRKLICGSWSDCQSRPHTVADSSHQHAWVSTFEPLNLLKCTVGMRITHSDPINLLADQACGYAVQRLQPSTLHYHNLLNITSNFPPLNSALITTTRIVILQRFNVL